MIASCPLCLGRLKHRARYGNSLYTLSNFVVNMKTFLKYKLLKRIKKFLTLLKTFKICETTETPFPIVGIVRNWVWTALLGYRQAPLISTLPSLLYTFPFCAQLWLLVFVQELQWFHALTHLYTGL